MLFVESKPSDLFEKKVHCPVCEHDFKTWSIKTASQRILKKDTDLQIYYRSTNPYFYEVLICDSCGYSALKSDFSNIKSYQKDMVLNSIAPKWINRDYGISYTPETAIERYKLALISSIAIESKNSTIAMITLRLAWMYRLLGAKKEEGDCLIKSLAAFLKAYEAEDTPFYGMDRYTIQYLIGELHYRTGSPKEALRWLGQVITSYSASPRLKEMARTQKDKIKGLE